MALIDSYSETNSTVLRPFGTIYLKQAQSFQMGGDSYTLTSAKFYNRNNGSATGNAYAVVYATTGTYGTDSEPTGSALSTSDAVDVSTISTTAELVTYTFSGANQITLVSGTVYAVAFEYDSPDTNTVELGYDSVAPLNHGGDYSTWTDPQPFWQQIYASPVDTCFYVYGDIIVTDYTLTVNSSGASNVVISSSTGNGGTTNYTDTVTANDSVVLTAPLRPSGYRFVNWTGDKTSATNVLSFTMDDDITVTANYLYIKTMGNFFIMFER